MSNLILPEISSDHPGCVKPALPALISTASDARDTLVTGQSNFRRAGMNRVVIDQIGAAKLDAVG